MKIFNDNPYDIVMATCLAYLQTKNPRLVGRSFYGSMLAKMVKETGCTTIEIGRALQEFKTRRYPPPVTDLSAFTSLICGAWVRPMVTPHVFGSPVQPMTLTEGESNV